MSATGKYRTVVVSDTGAQLMTVTPSDGRGDATTLLPVLPAGSRLTIAGGRFTVLRHELDIQIDGTTTLTIVAGT